MLGFRRLRLAEADQIAEMPERPANRRPGRMNAAFVLLLVEKDAGTRKPPLFPQLLTGFGRHLPHFLPDHPKLLRGNGNRAAAQAVAALAGKILHTVLQSAKKYRFCALYIKYVQY
jgi:hypothetical protein